MKEKISDGRAETIVKAAQKRFGLYGVEKTTMREIAGDLHISKAALYYYFPDKESLYNTVIIREHTEFLKKLEEDISTLSDPAECLKIYALNRLSYFRKLLNLSRIRSAYLTELRPKLADSLMSFREEEMKLLVKVLKDGIIEGQFKIDDPLRTAMLFLDLLRGLRHAYMTDKDILVIDDKEYGILSEKVTNITEIFIKGLMYN